MTSDGIQACDCVGQPLALGFKLTNWTFQWCEKESQIGVGYLRYLRKTLSCWAHIWYIGKGYRDPGLRHDQQFSTIFLSMTEQTRVILPMITNQARINIIADECQIDSRLTVNCQSNNNCWARALQSYRTNFVTLCNFNSTLTLISYWLDQTLAHSSFLYILHIWHCCSNFDISLVRFSMPKLAWWQCSNKGNILKQKCRSQMTADCQQLGSRHSMLGTRYEICWKHQINVALAGIKFGQAIVPKLLIPLDPAEHANSIEVFKESLPDDREGELLAQKREREERKV